MAFNDSYRRQVALLLRTMPFIAQEASFALKGGTAINLFVRDLPRLSVDIDLTYLPLLPRARSLGAIDKAMQRIAARVQKAIKAAHVTSAAVEGAVTKLFVREAGVQIKIEVTPVMRGCAYAAELRGVSPAVEAAFGFAEMKVLSFPDLYAGKIVAAFDRQHPRDLFDVRDLLANEGIDDRLRAAFIVYLLSHNRPMAEVLAVRPKDIAAEFASGFQGMTAQPVALEELIAARAALVDGMITNMPHPLQAHGLRSRRQGHNLAQRLARQRLRRRSHRSGQESPDRCRPTSTPPRPWSLRALPEQGRSSPDPGSSEPRKGCSKHRSGYDKARPG